MDPAAREALEDEVMAASSVECLVHAEEDSKRGSEAGSRATDTLHGDRRLPSDLAAEQDQGLERELVARARSVRAKLLHAGAQIPECRGPDRAVGVRIGFTGDIELVHAGRRSQASAVDFVVVVAAGPGPDVRRLEH